MYHGSLVSDLVVHIQITGTEGLIVSIESYVHTVCSWLPSERPGNVTLVAKYSVGSIMFTEFPGILFRCLNET